MVFTIIVVSFACALAAVAFGITFWPVAVWALHRYARSWLGVHKDAARARLKGFEVIEEPWSHDRYSGLSLIVQYKHHRLRLMCADDGKVLHAAVTVSDE
jgi:hypothetical protein